MNNIEEIIKSVPKEKLVLADRDDRQFDAKFETKSITYLQDAMMRFRRNKSSLIAAYLILGLVLFAIFAPFVSKYDITYSDAVYGKVRPKIEAFERSGFWDGTDEMKLNNKYYTYIVGIGVGAEDYDGKVASWEEGMKSKYNPLVSEGETFIDETLPRSTKIDSKTYRYAMVDTYYFVGFKYMNISKEELKNIQKYEKENGLKILYPMVDLDSRYATRDEADANGWYMEKKGMPCTPKGKSMSLDDIKEKGFYDNYLRDENGDLVYFLEKGRSMAQIRVLYYNYYIYKNGRTPSNTFGSDANGNDILIRLAHAIRLSLALAISVSLINFFIGSMYGAVTGFYGGWVDIILERITDILNGMPFIIVATLFQLYFVKTGKVSVFGGLLFAFILTGWIRIGARVRTQFYRFKKQEYILAAKTLGAKDSRLMFKHIYPNAIGTIITATAFVIPGVILTESTLSYLGIVNFHGKTMASLGTMLGTAKSYLQSDPHILFFPALVISIMMISFNLFSNGLRDAFNPSLRGVEE